jgi:hypothetical protein
MPISPAGSVVVMEDIDVGMPEASVSLSREREDKDARDTTGTDADGTEKGKKKKKSSNQGSVTLSGLLNAIVSHACEPSVIVP